MKHDSNQTAFEKPERFSTISVHGESIGQTWVERVVIIPLYFPTLTQSGVDALQSFISAETQVPVNRMVGA